MKSSLQILSPQKKPTPNAQIARIAIQRLKLPLISRSVDLVIAFFINSAAFLPFDGFDRNAVRVSLH